MADYKVVIGESAEKDLISIISYISDTLLEPATAKRIFQSIGERVLSLSEMPERHQVILEEPYASLGIRKLLVENYTAFYLVNEAAREVHVIRILYNRREWQNLI